jgi:hypothetical protein
MNKKPKMTGLDKARSVASPKAKGLAKPMNGKLPKSRVKGPRI